MADQNQPRTCLESFEPPIQWTGCNWEPRRTVRFKDAGGQRYELDVADALYLDLFKVSTSTPQLRAVLLAWMLDPTLPCPPLHVELL